jgi:hypothetical protein
MVDAGLLQIAGVAISYIGLSTGLAKIHSDWAKWEKADLLVDGDWLKLAIGKDILDGTESDYRWSRENKVATRELKGTHSVVVAADEKKRTRYRIVRGHEGNLDVLLKRLEG